MSHPIPPGLWCVPSALSRPDRPSVARTATLVVLDELGYTARRYKGDNPHAQVRTWATRAARRYPGCLLLLLTHGHALVAQDGRVYDNHAPHGPPGTEHPYARTRVEDAYLVERRYG